MHEMATFSFASSMLICSVKVLSGLHAKCDQYGTQILRRFISQKQLEKFLRTIRWSRSQQKLDSGDFAVELDPRQVSFKPSNVSCVIVERLESTGNDLLT